MNACEASELLLDAVLELRETRHDRDAWRLVAERSVLHSAAQWREIERLRRQQAYQRAELRRYTAMQVAA